MKRFVPPLFATLTLAGCSQTAQRPPSNEYHIVGTDYAFRAPSNLPAGRATFRFVNKGKVRHELNITLLKEGVTVEQLISARKSGLPSAHLVEAPIGVLFAEAGDSTESGLSADLKPGRQYAVICILRNSEDAKRHFEMGMYSVINVDIADPSKSRAVASDTILATDYAFTYRRTLPSGKHDFVLRNEGKVRHEVSMALLKTGVTLERALEVAASGGNVEELIEADLGLLHASAGQTPHGRLTIDLLPGREYSLVCFARDTDKSPEHVELGMYGSIRVSDSAGG